MPTTDQPTNPIDPTNPTVLATTDPNDPSSPNVFVWVALGIIIFALIIGILVILCAILLWRHKRRSRLEFEERKSVLLQPVQYKQKPTNQEAPRTNGGGIKDGSDEAMEEYVEVTDQTGHMGEELLYEEITDEKQSGRGYLDGAEEYVESVDQFLPGRESSRAGLSGPGKKVAKPTYLDDRAVAEVKRVDLGQAAEPREAKGTTTGGSPRSGKSGPHYVNDMDEISLHLKAKPQREQERGSVPGTSGTNPMYVNDLSTLVQQMDATGSDEDEEGYLVFDPKRGPPKKRPPKERQTEEDALYENSIEPLKRDSVDTSDDLYENNSVRTEPPPSTLDRESCDDKADRDGRHYVNDLDKLVQQIQLKEAAVESSGAKHHPYVNNLASMVEEVLREEAEDADGAGGKDGHNYMNTSFLPSER